MEDSLVLLAKLTITNMKDTVGFPIYLVPLFQVQSYPSLLLHFVSLLLIKSFFVPKWVLKLPINKIFLPNGIRYRVWEMPFTLLVSVNPKWHLPLDWTMLNYCTRSFFASLTVLINFFFFFSNLLPFTKSFTFLSICIHYLFNMILPIIICSSSWLFIMYIEISTCRWMILKQWESLFSLVYLALKSFIGMLRSQYRKISLTCDNLMKCGYVMAGWCCMCKDDMETVDHLFLHCGVAREVWNYVLRSFGIEWVLSKRVIELLFGWWNWLGKSSSGVCNLVPSCLLWTIWWERNNRTFENIESPMGKIIEIFSGSFFDWSRAWGLTSSSSVGNVLESLNADYSAHSL